MTNQIKKQTMKNEIEFDADDYRNQLLGGRSDSEIENDNIEDGEKALQEHYRIRIDDDNEIEFDDIVEIHFELITTIRKRIISKIHEIMQLNEETNKIVNQFKELDSDHDELNKTFFKRMKEDCIDETKLNGRSKLILEKLRKMIM